VALWLGVLYLALVLYVLLAVLWLAQLTAAGALPVASAAAFKTALLLLLLLLQRRREENSLADLLSNLAMDSDAAVDKVVQP
jgi:hypothetical protein